MPPKLQWLVFVVTLIFVTTKVLSCCVIHKALRQMIWIRDLFFEVWIHSGGFHPVQMILWWNIDIANMFISSQMCNLGNVRKFGSKLMSLSCFRTHYPAESSQGVVNPFSKDVYVSCCVETTFDTKGPNSCQEYILSPHISLGSWHQAEWIHAVDAKLCIIKMSHHNLKNCWTGWRFSTFLSCRLWWWHGLL